MIRAYIEALNDLNETEVEIAFSEAARRRKFFPNPAEIREALEIMRDHTHVGKPYEFSPQCKRCGGTGYELVPHTRANEHPAWAHQKMAVRCNHGATT